MSSGSRRLYTIQAVVSAGTFMLAVFTYAGWVPDKILFPLDATALALLVFGLDLPRLSTGEPLKPTQRIPSVAFGIILYAGLRYEIVSHPLFLVFALVSMTVAWSGSVVWINRSIDWFNVGTRLKKRLQAATEAARHEDPAFEKKRASILWGLISAKSSSITTLGVLLYPVAAGYIGLMLLVAAIAVLEQVASAALLATPFLFLWSILRIKASRPAGRRAKLLRRLVTAWKVKEDREDLIARGIVRSLFTPIGLLSFFVMCACVFLALVGMRVMWEFFVLGFRILVPNVIATLILLGFFCSAVFLYPGYLAFCLFLHARGRKTPRVPAFAYLWLCFSLGTMFAVSSPLIDVVVNMLSRAGFQQHLFPAISFFAAIIIAINVAAESRPITKFNQHALLVALSSVTVLILWIAKLGTDFYLGMACLVLMLFGITLLMKKPVNVELRGQRRIGGILLSLSFLVATIWLAMVEMMIVVPLTLTTWILSLYLFFRGKRGERILKVILGVREELIEP
jgi:hypothetical protein